MQSELKDVEGLIDLSNDIEFLSREPRSTGGFANVYQGKHKTENFDVALKLPHSQKLKPDKSKKVSGSFLIYVFTQAVRHLSCSRRR